MCNKLIYVVLLLCTLGIQQADGESNPRGLLGYIIEELRFNGYEVAVREALFNLLDHTEEAEITVVVTSRNRIIKGRYPPRFYRRFNDLEVKGVRVIRNASFGSMDAEISLIEPIIQTSWTEMVLDVTSVLYGVYSRSSSFTLQRVGFRTWMVSDEVIYWEGVGLPLGFLPAE